MTGAELKAFRVRRRITQKEMADILNVPGVNRNAISQMERDPYVRPEVTKRIRELYGIDDRPVDIMRRPIHTASGCRFGADGPR